MKIRQMALAVSIIFLPLHAMAFQVTTDEALFNSLYQNPEKTIEFDHLIDGSTVFNASTSPLVTAYSLGQNRNWFSVRDYGWSNEVNIGSTAFNCNCAWTATSWDGSSITPENYGFLYLEFTGAATPFSINTGNNFLGYIPSSPSEKYFFLKDATEISSLRFGYSQATAVPEPQPYLLMIGGLALMGFVRRRSIGAPKL